MPWSALKWLVEAKALIHWVFIHPRKTWRPLENIIQEYSMRLSLMKKPI